MYKFRNFHRVQYVYIHQSLPKSPDVVMFIAGRVFYIIWLFLMKNGANVLFVTNLCIRTI